jgi:hypothetical protein
MLTTQECRNWDRGRTIIFLRKHKNVGLKFVGDFLPPINNRRRKLSSIEGPERNIRYFSVSIVQMCTVGLHV